jgi:small nuclear ribonucleoprotein (snRNP)-like protein
MEDEMADVDVWVYALSSVEGKQQRVTVHLYGGQSLKGVVVELDRARNTVVLDEFAHGSASTRHESPVHTILLTAVQAVTIHKVE